MYLQSVSMMPKGIFYADLRLANYLYFEVPLMISAKVNELTAGDDLKSKFQNIATCEA